MKYIGKLESVLLIRVTLPPLDKYIIFQPANQHYIFNNTVTNRLGLIGGPQRKTKIPHPRIPVNPSTLSTLPIGTNSDLAKLIFKPA